MKHHSYKASIKELKDTSEVEIKSSVSKEEFAEAVEAVLVSMQKEATMPGFRKGAAPIKMVREKLGDTALLSEAAERAIGHAYGHILEAEKIEAIGHPKVSITKIAEGNDLEFTLVTAVLPKIGKFDYKGIAAKENAKPLEKVSVTDEELAEEQKKIKDSPDAPKLTKEDLLKAKEYRAKEKKRLELIDALSDNMEIVIPEVLVESELNRIMAQMKYDIEAMGLSFDDYMKHINKKEDDMKKERRSDAIQRIKLDLAMMHIAKAENISADKEKVEAEVKHAMEHHKDIDADRARSYFSNIFLNQAVFEFLEKQK